MQNDDINIETDLEYWREEKRAFDNTKKVIRFLVENNEIDLAKSLTIPYNPYPILTGSDIDCYDLCGKDPELQAFAIKFRDGKIYQELLDMIKRKDT